ncbi:hypothetical protein K2Z83_15665 [Oscillochloris sp. ZM17-4]|uniref:hypothetical protein n=1 Tax=Oscillochloris sp. ZM17-4 TaxID=2866714 RepID=UPI001C7311CD|nr:hypothetical protein [Oscillochloris sp. ZM17-4]MBX0329115.1 hypothetical protein [Oscillochloris sp. ZM17-4]
MQQLSVEEAGQMAGLFGFTLHQLSNGRWVARDEARGLQTPDGAGISTAHATDDLGNLVVRARCADSLAGPMTIAEATEQLARLGFELRGGHHRTFGQEWWATSQAREVSTGTWLNLKRVLSAARAIVVADGLVERRQERMVDLTLQLQPLDLDPRPRLRPIASAREEAAARPAAGAAEQLSLGLDVADALPAPWRPRHRKR